MSDLPTSALWFCVPFLTVLCFLRRCEYLKIQIDALSRRKGVVPFPVCHFNFDDKYKALWPYTRQPGKVLNRLNARQ